MASRARGTISRGNSSKRNRPAALPSRRTCEGHAWVASTTKNQWREGCRQNSENRSICHRRRHPPSAMPSSSNCRGPLHQEVSRCRSRCREASCRTPPVQAALLLIWVELRPHLGKNYVHVGSGTDYLLRLFLGFPLSRCLSSFSRVLLYSFSSRTVRSIISRTLCRYRSWASGGSSRGWSRPRLSRKSSEASPGREVPGRVGAVAHPNASPNSLRKAGWRLR